MPAFQSSTGVLRARIKPLPGVRRHNSVKTSPLAVQSSVWCLIAATVISGCVFCEGGASCILFWIRNRAFIAHSPGFAVSTKLR